MNKKYYLEITKFAEDDVDSILLYFNSHFFNPRINENFLNLLNKQIENIIINPHLYEVKLSRNTIKIRVATFMNYLICYTVLEDEYRIIILRVFHQLEDYENKLSI